MYVIILQQLLLMVITISILFPLYFMFINAFKSREIFNQRPLWMFFNYTLNNFISAFKGKNFGLWFFNSTTITFFSVIISTFIALLAAYAFSCMEFKGRKILFKIIIPLMSVPPIAMIIPQFKLVTMLNLVNTRTSVVIIYIGLMLPFTIYIFRSFFVSIPKSLFEAAIIDGCTTLKILFAIVLPLSIPAIITSLMVNIVWIWNELLISLIFLQREDLRTLIVGITIFKSRFSLDVPVLMAGLIIATIPMIITYIFAQKYLTEGLIAGAIKE